MTLYEIDSRIAQLENAMEDGMVINEETGELLRVEEVLDNLQMAFEKKAEHIACWIKNLTAESTAIRAEEEALSKRRKAAEKKAERLRGYLLACMVRPDGTSAKVSGARCAVSIRKNPPSAVVDDDVLLPDRYKVRKITIVPDKAMIRERLIAGEEIPGAHLEQSRSVMIK